MRESVTVELGSAIEGQRSRGFVRRLRRLDGCVLLFPGCSIVFEERFRSSITRVANA